MPRRTSVFYATVGKSARPATPQLQPTSLLTSLALRLAPVTSLASQAGVTVVSFIRPQQVAQLVHIPISTLPATRGLAARPICPLDTTTLLVTPTPQARSRTHHQLRVSRHLRCLLLAHIMIRIVSRMRELQPAHLISTRRPRAVRPVLTWRIFSRTIINHITPTPARVGGKSTDRWTSLLRRCNDIREFIPGSVFTSHI